MRLFAISDLHVDHAANAEWVAALSEYEHQEDLLILAGDISHDPAHIVETFSALTRRFKQILFVPGNHDVWVRPDEGLSSFEKFDQVMALAEEHGVSTEPFLSDKLAIIPLLGWYDFSFGVPSEELRARWMDFALCDWDGRSEAEVTAHFLAMNALRLTPQLVEGGTLVSFSHFMPRLDVFPTRASKIRKLLAPVFGAAGIDEQVQALGSQIHIYGHSHLNRDILLDGRRYINNALGNPSETHICARELRCVWEG